MTSENSKDCSVAVIGGGLVGALQACVLAKKGYREVHLYEVRICIRKFHEIHANNILKFIRLQKETIVSFFLKLSI